MFNWIKKTTKQKKVAILGLVATICLLTAFLVPIQVSDVISPIQTIGVGQKVITIGHVAYAAGTADYTCDGVADNVQVQAAMDALPATGGQLIILAGNYAFAATVTRAIANVTVTGTGQATYIANDGLTALFTAGGNNWVFSNIETDAGSINMGATTEWMWTNVDDGTFYAYRSPYGQSVFNDATVASLTDSGLTNGRVPIAGVGGLLSDDADLTFAGDTLTATNIADSSLTNGRVPVAGAAGLLGDDADFTFDGDSLQVSGENVVRGYDYIVAASGSPTYIKAQADYVCNGTNDQVEIQAANDAADGGTVRLFGPVYNIDANLVIDNSTIDGGQGGNPLRTKGTTLICDATINVDYLTQNNWDSNGRIWNLRIENTAVLGGDALVEFSPSGRYESTPDALRNVHIVDTQAQVANSYGLYFYLVSNANDVSVAVCSFYNVSVTGFDIGVYVYTSEVANHSWFNANRIIGLNCYGSNTNIKFYTTNASNVNGEIVSNYVLGYSENPDDWDYDGTGVGVTSGYAGNTIYLHYVEGGPDIRTNGNNNHFTVPNIPSVWTDTGDGNWITVLDRGTTLPGAGFYGPETTGTISVGGVLTINEWENCYLVIGNGGAPDNLDTITGGRNGQTLLLFSNDGTAITVREVDNIALSAPRVLNQVNDTLLLVRRGTQWKELSYADND